MISRHVCNSISYRVNRTVLLQYGGDIDFFVSMATGLLIDKCFENDKKLLLNVKSSIIMHKFIK